MKNNFNSVLIRIGFLKPNSSMYNYFVNLVLPAGIRLRSSGIKVYFHSYTKIESFSNIKYFFHKRKGFSNIIGILIDEIQVLIFRLIKLNSVLVFNINQLLPTFLSSKYSIITIHDMIPYEYKRNSFLLYLFYKFYLKSYASRCLGIITVSNTSKEKISNYFRVNKNKILSIYNGIKFTDYSDSNVVKSKSLSFIYVGANLPNKNLKNLTNAFRLLGDKYILNMVGSCCSNKEVKLNYSICKNINLFPSLSDTELSNLYLKSTALIFPSLSEGFGLPLIEAMFYKLPILVSNRDFAREICKDYVFLYYFDPLNINSIIESVKSFSNDLNANKINFYSNNNEQLIIKYSWSNSQDILYKQLMYLIKEKKSFI
jgi:glycosyltransferase involved in cell wall biosynthesis